MLPGGVFGNRSALPILTFDISDVSVYQAWAEDETNFLPCQRFFGCFYYHRKLRDLILQHVNRRFGITPGDRAIHFLASSIGGTVYSMSKKASISKRGGQPTGPLRDAISHENSTLKASPSTGDIDPLDVFDVLLPACENSSTAGFAPLRTPAIESRKATSAHQTFAPERSLQPIGAALSQGLVGDSISSTSDQIELIESLRYWESELRQIESDLQHKVDDLAARRRAFAREIRSRRRDHQQSAKTISGSDQTSEITANTDARLAEMQSQIEMLVMLLRDAWPTSSNQSDDQSHRRPLDGLATTGLAAAGNHDEAFLVEIDSLKSQLESLVEQNNQLATELAHLTVQRTVDQSSDAAASMSWEERKELLYRQFESEDNGLPVNPEQLTSEQCSRLNHEMACMQQELRARENEVAELRSLLEQRPEVQDHDLAVGAAAITRLFDDDELIREERSRLKEIQAEWETKFRDMEIAASIERASLARERRQLECQNAELEEQLAHLKQELRQESIAGPSQPRRWFAKLGLSE